MELALKHQLNQLVTEYRQWLKANFSIKEIDQNLTDESAYPQWQDIESFFKELIEAKKLDLLDEEDLNNLLYLIARNEENGRLIAWFSNAEQLSNIVNLENADFLKLAQIASRCTHNDYTAAKYQFAAAFRKFHHLTVEIEAILLRFFDDSDEYTRRQSLISLAKFKYPQIQELLKRSWEQEEDEHHKMACLFAIDEYLKDANLMRYYLALAEKEKGQYLTAFIRQLKENPDYR